MWSILRWTQLCVVIGVMAGAASALFLYILDLTTRFREAHNGLLFFLPMGGFAVGWLYHRWGREVEAGNSLILEEIHNPKKAIPARLAPLIFTGTICTHLFGGSAGREGTAVQMGGGLADLLTRPFALTRVERRTLLMVGMSAGFASVFGVPLAGTLFGVEVLSSGRHVEWRSLPQCLLAAFVAHFTCLFLGIHHTEYALPQLPVLSFSVFYQVIVAGAIFGGLAWLFSHLSHLVKKALGRCVRYYPFRPALGGLFVFIGYSILGTNRFAGLGVPVIQSSLTELLPAGDFAWKSLFTILTLSSGLKGGEVTPLLFIGATLGNALSTYIPLHFSFLAALGLVAVFAGAAKTPWACALMGIEIFGADFALWSVLVCVTSHLCSSHTGIYQGQLRSVQRVNLPQAP